jgi:hypothetical protein
MEKRARMTDAADRRAQLIAAAATWELTAAEAVELERLTAADPSVRAEVLELRATISRTTGALGGWDDAAPPPALRDRVLALESPTAPVAPLRARSRRPLLVGLAAACLVVGAGAGAAVSGLVDPGPQPQATGAPGVLGALEHIDFTGEPGGVAIDGSLVAHTWGTETVLEIAGLPAGDSYSVVLVGSDGVRFDSGSFVGSTVTIDCRMNAAVLRPEVASVAIEDVAGHVVASAALPAVES